MAGGNQPDPDEIERRLRELSEEVGKPRVHEPSARERLAAARPPQQQKARRKRNKGVLTAAGNLDWPTLRGGAPTAFANLLTRQERKVFLAGLQTTALDKDGSEKNTRTWVTSFAPGSTQFVTTVVKVHGTMSAGTARNSGIEVLRIKVDYLFAFAVEPPGQPADWMRVIQQQYGYVDFARWDDPGGPLEPLVSIGSGTAGAQCDARDGYVHLDFPQGPPDSVKASGAPEDPYSLATPSESSGSGCQNVTRT
jgi:hypothetical protein